MYALKSPMPQVISNTTLNSLCTSLSSVLVTGVSLRASHTALIFVT